MAKIIINKSEDARAVIKKIENSESRKIILVIPRQSVFGEEVSNFELLREAATELDKEIAIESVDENMLALARANEFEALHPLFEGGAQGKVSDILPAKNRGKASILRRQSEPIHHLEVESGGSSEEILADEHGHSEEVYEPVPPKKIPPKRIFYFIGGIIVLVGIFFAGTAIFARADISLRFKKTPWQDASIMKASIDQITGTLKAQIFNPVKSATPLFPASGKSQVSIKAEGRITIFNAYSSKSQQLVATTRFETPDGKILRLKSQITVPGAKIQDGKIIPSSIEADIIADKPGAEYNVGPIEKLTIPGFEGSPRFDGFYGKIDSQLKGGFVGVRQVPTAADIASAKTKTTELLKAAFGPNFLETISGGLMILDGASAFEVTKLTVDPTTDNDGNFSVLGQAKYTAIGFKEEDLRAAILVKAREQDSNASFESINLKYSKIQPDFKKGTLTFEVDSEGVVTPAFDPEAFKASVLGKPATEVKGMILGLPELSDGKISLSPAWISTVPASAGKVRITVE
ncbi:MAG: Uncharacterized protein LiPW15_29 [Parcubacteria group bacterium LiPW_15]|nr:MAG: Uncharacterized protein LiPW15_29 [Parcubacteria group bacterium LiPW_15]